MRTHRLLAALLGLALLGLTPLTFSSSAVAAPAGSSGAVAAAAPVVPLAARAKLPRELNDRSVRRGSSWFIKGRVSPEGSRKVVVFKRKLGPHKAWRTWKRVRADRKGRFVVRVAFPSGTRSTWFYKGAVKSTARYQAARTDKIYTACRRARC
ncbi:hypothetical protein [Nocardioides sp. W7]|uniref:hypothetical protein n=1 Tax=Nocardioides sp. W7 TaxID=2931390 RepID=UPI001FD0C0CB|nr:hypothetical protein [Nocardioides sp. W7]